MLIRSILYITLIASFFFYSGFIYTVGTETANSSPILTGDIQRGKRAFQKFNCSACHQIYGLGGHLGPDLTNAMSHPHKGEAYVRAILKSGIGAMPSFPLLSEEIDDLVNYLKYIDSTGMSPPRSATVTAWGSISVGTK